MTRACHLIAAVLVLAGCASPGVSGGQTEGPRVSPSLTSGSPPASEPSGELPSAPAPSVAPSGPPASPVAAAAWSELAPAGSPSRREDHTWTVDADGERAYLFGGRDGTTVHGDLWAYDLAADTWAQVGAPSGPAPRFGHDAAWVDGIGLVIFGGQAGPTFFNDLWAFDPGAGAWRALEASGAIPVARYGSCAAIGPDGRLWVSHGFTSDGTRFADTVAYDVSSGIWTDETPAGNVPVNRCLHGCWWTDDGAFALYAGQTTGVTALGDRWILERGAWSRVDGTLPPDRNLYAHARVEGATVVFGGQALDGGFLADTWVLEDGGADARPLEVTGPAPGGRAGAELIFDRAQGRVLLFGGRDSDGTYADLWELSGLPPAG